MVSSGTLFIWVLVGAIVAYILHAADGRYGWNLIGTLLTCVALLTLTVALVVRGTRAGHWPLANRFEFALCFAWAVLAFYLLIERAMGTSSGGAFVLPLALLITLWAARRPEVDQILRPLSPVLRTGWFPLHVGCSAMGYGAFTVAGGFGVLFLVGPRLSRRGLVLPDGAPRHPSPEQIEYVIWRAVALGFPWLTLGILTGAIWAQVAWGRYWDWDPKESWTLITWLTYLILLHGRALRGWRGRRVAWLAVIGLGAVAFTFLGVGSLVRMLRLESVHIF